MRIRNVALACAAALAIVAPASAVWTSTVIATGLNNPRGLAFGPDGGLYVAEAGTIVPTGSGPTTIARGTTFTYAETGSITKIAGGSQARIITGLPSLSAAATGEISGPQDIVFLGGAGFVVIGTGAINPTARTTDLAAAPGAVNIGAILGFSDAGVSGQFSDPAAFELAVNPAGGPIDSNPYHFVPGAAGLLLTDAGGNSLLSVAGDGTVSLISTFPARPFAPTDSVPTGVAVGPDGNYYVGELTGAPFTPGAANIYSVTPGGTVTVAYSGFTHIGDIAFGADGTLFVLEIDSDGLFQGAPFGSIIEILADGTRQTIFDGLFLPTGLEVGLDGALYVTNFSAGQPGAGQVLRIAEVPEPAALALLGLGAIGLAARRRRAWA